MPGAQTSKYPGWGGLQLSIITKGTSSWKGHPPLAPAPPPTHLGRAGPKGPGKIVMDAVWYHRRLVGWESRAVGTRGCSAGLLSSVLLSRSRHAAPSLCEGCSGGGRDKADSLSTVTTSSPRPKPSTACSGPRSFSKITGCVDSISQDVPQPAALSEVGQTLRKALCKNAGILKRDSYLDDLPSYLAQAVSKLSYAAGIIKIST